MNKNVQSPEILHKLLAIINKKERENLKNLSPNELKNKIKSLTEIINKIDGNSNFRLGHELFEEIKKLAVNKGGLLLNSYRGEILKKTFLLNDEEIHFYYFKETNGNKRLNKKCIDLKRFYNSLYSNESVIENEIPFKRTTKRDEYIIEVDVKRTIANSYFTNCEDELDILKQNLIKFLKLFFNLNPQYGYYQGFHDVALYIFLIFYNHEHLAIQMIQRIAEFYLKDYMVDIDNNINLCDINLKNDSDNKNTKILDKNFQFETVFRILNSISAHNDKKFWKFIQEHTDSSNTVNTLPWVITLFTHDVQDLCIQLRILDYILFSHPSVVYQMASYVSFM